jgi:predicted metallo-beta-lactamase superfamily hydrolase
MQGEIQSGIPSWLITVLTNLATFIALGTALYKERQGRKKIEADVSLQKAQMHLSDAQSRLTDVQVETVQLTNRKSAIEIIDGCLTRIDGLELQVDELKGKNRQLESVIQINSGQISSLKCVLDLNGINYGEVLDKIKGIQRDEAS